MSSSPSFRGQQSLEIESLLGAGTPPPTPPGSSGRRSSVSLSGRYGYSISPPPSPTLRRRGSNNVYSRSLSFSSLLRGGTARIRTLVVGVCCLVVLALAFNIIVSTKMALVFEEEASNDVTDIPLLVIQGNYQNKTSDNTNADSNTASGDGNSMTNNDGGDYSAANSEDHNNRTSSLADNSTVLPPGTIPPAENTDTTAVPIQYDSSSDDWFHSLEQDPSTQKLPPLIPNASSAFAGRWCDLTHVKEWWPTAPSSSTPDSGNDADDSSSISWQLRAPYVMIPGAKHGGTLELATLLHQHPGILPPRKGSTAEVSFFYNRNFASRYVHPLTEKTKVHQARQRLYAVSGWDQLQKQQQQLQQSGSVGGDVGNSQRREQFPDQLQLLAIDATPSYLFYSSLLPRRILCVLPWVRLIVVLRNPVDRVIAQYQHARQRQNLRLSIENWLERDLQLLRKAGFLDPNATTATLSKQEEQDVAWYNYLSTTVDGSIGRSLYEIQLRQWFQALRAVGRNPSDSVYVLMAEDLVAQPQAQLERILRFLNLKDAPFQTSAVLKSLQPAQLPSISAETRQRLETLFRPYNKKLKKLLRTYGAKTSG